MPPSILTFLNHPGDAGPAALAKADRSEWGDATQAGAGAAQITLLNAVRAGQEYLGGSNSLGCDRLESELLSIAALWNGNGGQSGAAEEEEARERLPPLLELELRAELANLCAALPHAVASSRDAIARSEAARDECAAHTSVTVKQLAQLQERVNTLRQVSYFLCTVTFHANTAHDLTRLPIVFDNLSIIHTIKVRLLYCMYRYISFRVLHFAHNLTRSPSPTPPNICSKLAAPDAGKFDLELASSVT